MPELKILENSKDHLDDFIRLNEAWISKYFAIEDADRELAQAPYKVIENGGYIFTLIDNDVVVGVCALFADKDKTFELARMAVDESHQGKGYGNRLMQTCLNKLKEVGAKKVYLVSNTKLDSAINLYKKFGFQTTFEGQHPTYKRANIIMKHQIT